jgi:hypothetical protein
MCANNYFLGQSLNLNTSRSNWNLHHEVGYSTKSHHHCMKVVACLYLQCEDGNDTWYCNIITIYTWKLVLVQDLESQDEFVKFSLYKTLEDISHISTLQQCPHQSCLTLLSNGWNQQPRFGWTIAYQECIAYALASYKLILHHNKTLNKMLLTTDIM